MIKSAALVSCLLTVSAVAVLPNYSMNMAEVPNFALENEDTADLPGVPKQTVSGACQNVQLQEDFDIKKYAGVWFWVSIIDNPFLGKLSKCLRSTYNYSPEMVGFRVTTSGSSVDDKPLSMTGNIRTTKEFPHAAMSIDFENVVPANFKVIETDYSNYSCVYSCTGTNAFKTEFGFVFSRNLNNNHIAADNCAKAFKKNGINVDAFKHVDQSC